MEIKLETQLYLVGQESLDAGDCIKMFKDLADYITTNFIPKEQLEEFAIKVFNNMWEEIPKISKDELIIKLNKMGFIPRDRLLSKGEILKVIEKEQYYDGSVGSIPLAKALLTAQKEKEGK